MVLHDGRGVERTEEDGAADAEFEAMLSKTMSESVEKTKIARATTQVFMAFCLLSLYLLKKNFGVIGFSGQHSLVCSNFTPLEVHLLYIQICFETGFGWQAAVLEATQPTPYDCVKWVMIHD